MNAVARRSAAPQVDQSERAWWLRTLAVLQSPRSVFGALRDDSVEAAASRQEPVTAIVILAGIGAVLASPATGRLMDDFAIDGLTAAIIVFLQGGLYGCVAYWLAGGMLYFVAEHLGSRGSYRRSRHVLAYASVPLVLSLVVIWPLRLALYGEDVFRSGGRDAGLGGHVFVGLELVFATWSVGLLVVGIRAVHAWTWPRAIAACVLAVALTAALIALLDVILRGA
jgi:hypothetical protein